MFGEIDHRYMSQALALAQHALWHATPNPRVGCVLVRDGLVLGAGFTQAPGLNHAEVEALLDARRNGHDAHGATAYVTLEPCSHFGRTPACATALIEARVARVIAAVEDPNPLVSGRGLAMLRDAGIDVRCGLLQQEAIELNQGFFSRMTRGRPWVRLKIAASLDGKTALHSGVSQWITSEQARADGHAWRARSCALLTGSGTVRQDNPQMSVRLVAAQRQPLKVVVTSDGALDPQARVFLDTPVLVACARPVADETLFSKHPDVHFLALPDAHGRVDLDALMRALAQRGVNEVQVEAGSGLNGAFVAAGLADELLIYFAPSLIGEARGMAHLAALSDLGQAKRLVFHSVAQVGQDLRVVARFLPS